MSFAQVSREEGSVNALLRLGVAALTFTVASTVGCQEDQPAPLPQRGMAADAAASRAPATVPRTRIPDVTLGQLGPAVPATPPYKKTYQFTDDWFSQDIPIWEKAMAPYRGKPKLHYLEVGTFEGRSALWMIENVLTDPTSKLTVIDPFLDDYKNRYRANLKTSGAAARVTTIEGYSQVELRKIPMDSCDFVYIDGSHRADDVLEDAILAWRLVKKGGLLLFDDYRWTGWKSVVPLDQRPGPAIDTFYEFYGKHFDVIHNGYQLILRKR